MGRIENRVYGFQELKKAYKNSFHVSNTKKFRLAVLGNCSTQFLAVSIKGHSNLVDTGIDIFDADYNQIETYLLDKGSELYSFEPDGVLIFLSTDKLYEDFLDASFISRKEFANEIIKKIERYWNRIAENIGCSIIQMNFTEIHDNVLGNYGAKIESTFSYQIRKLNYLLQEKMSSRRDVYPVDLLGLQIQLGTHLFYDPSLYYNAKMTIALDALPYVAKTVVDIINAMNGRINKCIICDLDNTLWGGVIGDDGMGGIEIGEYGRGHAFSDFQRWLKQLKEYGIILSICSKNNEEVAKEPFEKHEEMVLRLSDISIFVANWEDKASNISHIQKSLNIGMDSIVFIDDNIFERNLVRELIPNLVVPELPNDPAMYLQFLQEQNYFEVASFTGESSDRTAQYQAEFKRKKFENDYVSIDDYLNGLEMIGQARPFEPIWYARIAQLSQRSNQFNLRTVRYKEDEIKQIAENDRYLTRYFTLKDKFGDYGLVAAVIIDKQDDDTGFVESWFMSCRVLKRGMEEFIVNKMIKAAKDEGLCILKAEYIPTSKNAMVKQIYESFGFNKIAENQYEIEVSHYKEKKNHIEEGM